MLYSYSLHSIELYLHQRELRINISKTVEIHQLFNIYEFNLTMWNYISPAPADDSSIIATEAGLEKSNLLRNGHVFNLYQASIYKLLFLFHGKLLWCDNYCYSRYLDGSFTLRGDIGYSKKKHKNIKYIQ